ncbi:MAG: TRAP transporter large permease [Geminicoccaceae bacterium]|nr:MAG: TRAP transporter large permease [Geminicoccaceae bacterium]
MNATVILALLILIGFGVPIATSLALAAIYGIDQFTRLPMILVAQRMFAGIDSFPLMAIPLFIFAGNLMAAGGISARLVEFARALVGQVQGGLAASCVVTCMIFAAVSGSSVATTFAIGAILIPAMVKNGYPKPKAAAIQATSAELGVLIPPSIPLILYGVATDTSIGQLFIAGFGPGLLVAFALTTFLLIYCRVYNIGNEASEPRIPLGPAALKASAALVMPVIVVGGIYGGVFTPTEASAVAVAYALLVGTVIYRELTLPAFIRVLRETAIATAVVMLIIAAAALFSFVITRMGLPAMATGWVRATFTDAFTFLLAVNLFLFVVGMFIETAAAILVLAPILAPMAVAFGVDPVHFGLIMVINLATGMITPPVGVNLFAACTVAKLPIERIIPPLLPLFAVMIACVFLVTYIPAISIGLRDLLY